MLRMWSFDQIEILTGAYKEETCFYATTEVSYRNKYLSGKVLKKIVSNVKLRSTTNINYFFVLLINYSFNKNTLNAFRP